MLIKPIKNKKNKKIKILFSYYIKIVKNNLNLFVLCTLLSLLISVVNFNIYIIFKNFIQSYKHEENLNKNIFKVSFPFSFSLFGLKIFKEKEYGIKQFLLRTLGLIFILKSSLSLLHFYLMHYSYDLIEKNLKKELLKKVLDTKYQYSSEVSRDLISQFSNDLDTISRYIWFIPNKLIISFVYIFQVYKYDFNFGTEEGINWRFILITIFLFSFNIIEQIILYRKAIKKGLEAKLRNEEDNKEIWEKIYNLEYIKYVSGENYSYKKISKKLDDSFKKNMWYLFYSVAFKAFPSYVIGPNIPSLFLTIAVLTTIKKDINENSVYLVKNFFRYYFSVAALNREMEKIMITFYNVEELVNSLEMLNNIFSKIIREKNNEKNKNLNFFMDDINFEEVTFSYPSRPNQKILEKFTFSFLKGKTYGISGKNGIGKSTITKTLLKIYDLEKGKIKIGSLDIKDINTKELQGKICYQSNHPSFFKNMSIAENIFFPYEYNKKEHLSLLEKASEKVGIKNFIDNLPKKFDTKLHDGGSDLSEGQKQQIFSIKLFIKKDYKIYIFDEIWSNVHPTLKEKIFPKIFFEIKKKDVIILMIDHHYEIFKYADHILEFKDNKMEIEKNIKK